MYRKCSHWFASLVISAFIATTAFGTDSGSVDLQNCKKISTAMDRLECYDAVVGRPSLVGSKVAGNWSVNTQINPLDDSKTVYVVATSTSGGQVLRSAPKFVARCESNKTEVYIDWDTYVGDDSQSVNTEWKQLTVRIGESPAQKQTWNVSTNRTGTFSRDAIPLLRKMVNVDRIVVQIVPYGENPVTAIFPTSGLSEVLRPLAETCHWSF